MAIGSDQHPPTGAEERVPEIEDELRIAAGLAALRENAGVSQREMPSRHTYKDERWLPRWLFRAGGHRPDPVENPGI